MWAFSPLFSHRFVLRGKNMNRFLLALSFLAAVPAATFAAESGTAVFTASGSGSIFNYTGVLNNTSTDGSTIGTLWFSWVPGEDFLPTSPTNVTSPTGWQDVITHGGSTDGFAIQWTAMTPAADLAAGASLTGFGFTSADTPAQLQGNSPFYPGTPVGTAFLYTGEPFSDGGTDITASTVVAPEPASLGALALGGLLLLRRRR
jgi:hypothetical protein